MRVAFFGSSLLSSYWNGAATYYRGLIHALSKVGVRTTFFEPNAYGRQQHRDIDPPDWAEVVVYEPTIEAAKQAVEQSTSFDVIVKASGIGILDNEILEFVALLPTSGLKIYWDVDAPATLAEVEGSTAHPLRKFLPLLDGVCTYGGGDSVVRRYLGAGARRCEPVYNALDPDTHFRVAPDPAYSCDLAFLGNRLPDREQRVRDFLIDAACALPSQKFILAGAGWRDCALPSNLQAIGHLPTHAHNAFNSSARAVLNISRSSMAAAGFSPATRVFEAAGAAACIITDEWDGIGQFLEPGREILVAASGKQVAEFLVRLGDRQARAIGERALRRVLSTHTYDRRAKQVVGLLSQWRTERNLTSGIRNMSCVS